MTALVAEKQWLEQKVHRKQWLKKTNESTATSVCVENASLTGRIEALDVAHIAAQHPLWLVAKEQLESLTASPGVASSRFKHTIRGLQEENSDLRDKLGQLSAQLGESQSSKQHLPLHLKEQSGVFSTPVRVTSGGRSEKNARRLGGKHVEAKQQQCLVESVANVIYNGEL